MIFALRVALFIVFSILTGAFTLLGALAMWTPPPLRQQNQQAAEIFAWVAIGIAFVCMAYLLAEVILRPTIDAAIERIEADAKKARVLEQNGKWDQTTERRNGDKEAT